MTHVNESLTKCKNDGNFECLVLLSYSKNHSFTDDMFERWLFFLMLFEFVSNWKSH